MKRWLVLFTLIVGASSFAHEVKVSCEDSLLSHVTLYRRLIDLGLERGWIDLSHLRSATPENLKVLKKGNADATTLPLAKELAKVTEAMSPSERATAYAFVTGRLQSEAQRETQMQVAQEQTKEIFSPRLVKTMHWVRPTKSGKVSLFLHPRPGQSPLVLMDAENNIQIFDPEIGEDSIQRISKSNTAEEISNVSAPFTSSDGNLLIAFNRRVENRIEYAVKDLISKKETVLDSQSSLGRTTWVRGADGRDFAVLNDSRKTEVFELKHGESRSLISEKAKFLALLSNAAGLVRVVISHGDNIQILDENGRVIQQWSTAGHVQSVDAFLTHQGEVVLRALISPNFSHLRAVFYKEGLSSGINHILLQEHQQLSSQTLWHETASGRLLFASYHAEKAQIFNQKPTEVVFEIFDPFVGKIFYHDSRWVSGPMHWETTPDGERLFFPTLSGLISLHWNDTVGVFDGERDTSLTQLKSLYHYARDLTTQDLMIFSTTTKSAQLELSERLHELTAYGGDQAQVVVEGRQIFYANVDSSHESVLKIRLYSLYSESGKSTP